MFEAVGGIVGERNAGRDAGVAWTDDVSLAREEDELDEDSTYRFKSSTAFSRLSRRSLSGSLRFSPKDYDMVMER